MQQLTLGLLPGHLFQSPQKNKPEQASSHATAVLLTSARPATYRVVTDTETMEFA
jgi:hypothetical protein